MHQMKEIIDNELTIVNNIIFVKNIKSMLKKQIYSMKYMD